MIAALLLAAAPAITPQEAQSLPVADLAQRVLGEVAALVVDVERPKWPVCIGLCPSPDPRPEGPPPLTSLTFYTQASATTEGGWLGTCRATSIEVSFDRGGKVNRLVQRNTVGWLGALTRVSAGVGTAGAKEQSAQYADFESRCRALPTTRAFVPAFGPLDGERALIAVALIHDSMVNGGPIRVTCEWEFKTCGSKQDLRGLADDVAVAKITGIEQVDPQTGSFVTGGAAGGGCYLISLAQPFGQSDQITVCMHVGDVLTVSRAAFSRSRVVY